MNFTQFILVAVLALFTGECYSAAAKYKITMYESDNSCVGAGFTCPSISAGVCCYRSDRLSGAGEGSKVNGKAGELQLFSKRSSSSDYCQLAVTNRRKIPVCIKTNQPASVTGGVVFPPSGSKRGLGGTIANEQGSAEPCQLGELTYTDVDKVHYLHHDKYEEYMPLTNTTEKKDFIINNSYKVEDRGESL